MTTEEKRQLILSWHGQVTKLDKAWKEWKAIGVSIEGRFPGAAFTLLEHYTKSIEALAECPGWLEWFQYEMPKEGGSARVNSMRPYTFIVTLDDLVDFLEKEVWK